MYSHSALTPLFLVLLFGEALALGDDQIAVSPLSVVVRDVGVGGKARVDILIGRDAREGNVLLLAVLIRGDRNGGDLGLH